MPPPPCRLLLRPPLLLRRLHHPPRLHTRSRQAHRSLIRLTPPRPRRSAIDPLTFLIAAAVSSGIAYIATKYTLLPSEKRIEQSEVPSSVPIAPSAPEKIETMASQIPPGRPGNLTAEQEVKLKEMWVATLDVFGVVHEDKHANGTATLSSISDEPGKKKKSRLSLFKKKDKGDASDASSIDENDKHGQTKAFQQALASESPEQLRRAFWSMVKHDHPDALLLRFLRARKWDVHAALVMLVSTMHWRSTEMHVDDDIMLHGEPYALKEEKSSAGTEKKEGEDFMAQIRMGKSFLHGTDKDGRPCCYVRARLHKPGQQSEQSLERFTVYTIETARMLLRPPVDTATIVFDMTDFSMSNMDYTPVKFMIKCFEANYPESLGSVLVYHAPWIFSGIWKIIKGWLDPVVASKVHFCSSLDELADFIPKSKIMKELGGAENYTYTYVEPREGENARMQDTAAKEQIQAQRKEMVEEYERTTMGWMHDENKGEERGAIASRLAENYWRLDPYVRARSLYDRTGIIGAEGKLDPYPSAASAQAAGAALQATSHDDVD